MARNPAIQERLDNFIVSQGITGRRRAVLTLYRNLANALARELEDDSFELLESLAALQRSKELAVRGALNPQKLGEKVKAENDGKMILGSASQYASITNDNG